MQAFLCLLLLSGSIVIISCREIKRQDFDPLNFLEETGYLDAIDDNNRYHAPDNVKQAVKEFQQFYDLPVTGHLDKRSVEKMKEPRCGVPDVVPPSKRPQDQTDGPLSYSFKKDLSEKWRVRTDKYSMPHYDITYTWNSFTKKLPEDVQRQIMTEAFKKWMDVANLNITENFNGKLHQNIDIRFDKWAHYDLSIPYSTVCCDGPFDGPGGKLAHAFAPRPQGWQLDGDIHFDDSENWRAAPKYKLNKKWGPLLGPVALHEIGHALGLQHSSNSWAIMSAVYSSKVLNLHQDDINGIQALYGKSQCAQTFDAIEGTEAYVGDQFFKLRKDGTFTVLGMLLTYKSQLPIVSPDAVVEQTWTFDSYTGQVTYFFKGKQVWKYKGGRVMGDIKKPKTLKPEFQNIDGAAFKDGNIFVFKETPYNFDIKVYNASSRTVEFYDDPKPIAYKWIGNPTMPIDTAWVSPADGYLYLFHGQKKHNQQYERYEIVPANESNGTVLTIIRSPGYPKSVKTWFCKE